MASLREHVAAEFSRRGKRELVSEVTLQQSESHDTIAVNGGKATDLDVTELAAVSLIFFCVDIS